MIVQDALFYWDLRLVRVFRVEFLSVSQNLKEKE